VSKDESLEVGPDLIHGLNKEIGIISFNHTFNLRPYILQNKDPDILPNLMTNLCLIRNNRFRNTIRQVVIYSTKN